MFCPWYSTKVISAVLGREAKARTLSRSINEQTILLIFRYLVWIVGCPGKRGPATSANRSLFG